MMDASLMSPTRGTSAAFQALTSEAANSLATLMASAANQRASEQDHGVSPDQRRSSGGHSSSSGLQFSYEGRVRVLAGFDEQQQQNQESSSSSPPSGTNPNRSGHNNNGISLSLSLSSATASSPGGASSPAQVQHQDDDITDNNDSLERLKQMAGPGLDTSSSSLQPPTPSALLANTIEQVMQKGPFICHLCSFTSDARSEFNLHVNTHYKFRCTKCDFETQDEEAYRVHLGDVHQTTPEAIEEEGIRQPRVNSQGKVKTHKCKHCEYVSVTKEEFWIHQRIHIKPEKRLHCPKCLFVTDLKHHLEYHLRNHYGSKPHKCTECSYSCVNKSMLASHLKSHMTLYQYRCKDCNYVTKYCHSLKLHARKYQHEPAMVLNLDGTPNPLPIIDVYGTRRGPKMKKDETTEALKAAVAAARAQKTAPAAASTFKEGRKRQSSAAFPRSLLPDLPPKTEPQLTVPPPQLSSFRCELCGFQSATKEVYLNHMAYHNKPSSSPDRSSSLHTASDEDHRQEDESSVPVSPLVAPTTPQMPFPGMFPDGDATSGQPSSPYLDYLRALLQMSKTMPTNGNPPIPSAATITSSHIPVVQPTSPNPQSALLSRMYLENMAKKLKVAEAGSLGSKHSEDSDENSEPQQLEVDSNGAEEEEEVVLSVTPSTEGEDHSQVKEAEKPAVKRKRKSTTPTSLSAATASQENKKLRGAFVCEFCDMAFMDEVMYEVHKGYHGFQKPFECNMCGEEMQDKVSFFLHVARKSH